MYPTGVFLPSQAKPPREKPLKKSNKSSSSSITSANKSIKVLTRKEQGKLKELICKKTTLLSKLREIGKNKIKTPTTSLIKSISYTTPNTTPNLQNQRRSFPIRKSRYLSDRSEQAIGQSRNFRYKSPSLSKQKTPDSITSPEKNKSILNFIQKMHHQTIVRDISRTKQYHKKVEQDLKIELQIRRFEYAPKQRQKTTVSKRMFS